MESGPPCTPRAPECLGGVKGKLKKNPKRTPKNPNHNRGGGETKASLGLAPLRPPPRQSRPLPSPGLTLTPGPGGLRPGHRLSCTGEGGGGTGAGMG